MAGGELAIQARQQSWAGKILLLGNEAHLPYHRPMLSKAYLTGKSVADALAMRAADAYDTANIEVRLHQTVTRVDRVLAVEAVNKPVEFMMARKLLDSGAAVTAKQLADAAIALRDLAR